MRRKQKWVKVDNIFFDIHRVVEFKIGMRVPGDPNEAHGVYAQFDFCQPFDLKRRNVVAPYCRHVGEYGTYTECEQLVTDIVNGKYDVQTKGKG